MEELILNTLTLNGQVYKVVSSGGGEALIPYIGDNGNWWVEETDTGVRAQGPQGEPGETGPQGEPGETGADGFSPVVEVTEITGGHRVTITDATGTQTFDVMDGEDGADGDVGSGLPSVTTDDDGKFLQVVDGAWAAVALADVSEEGM